MDASSNLNLPFIIAAQAQKHVTHNEALRSLDAIVQLMVLDKDLASPPGSPAEGDRYIVAASPAGAWIGQAGRIAAYQDGAWAFYAPQEGWLAWVADEDSLYVWSGTAWAAFAGSGGGGLADLADDTTPELGGDLDANGHNVGFDNGTGIIDDAGNEQVVFRKTASAVNQVGITNAATGNAPQVAAEGGDINIDLTLAGKGSGHPKAALFGINATADTTTRLAVSAAASLFNHAGNGHQHKINKNAAADTASLLFQTATSGRAEMGTAGDDDFHFKVSADGSTWKEAIVIDRTTGRATFPLSPLADAACLVGYLSGLRLSNNTTDATNDIDIAAGVAVDAGNATFVKLASGLTKRLDAAWAVGTNQGGLDTGSIANTTYHVYLIQRSDTGVVDALFSTSPTSPTMPTSYDRKRRIGAILREGGGIVAFLQDGDYFRRKVAVQDVAATNPGTSAVTATLSVPTGINVFAYLLIHISAGTTSGRVLVSDIDGFTDAAPNNTTGGVGSHTGGNAAQDGRTSDWIRTNTSAQVRYRCDASDGSTGVYINTHGWRDRRGREG